MKLSDFSANVYSQYGEDGIIQKIIDIMGVGSQTCIEFGAWDGYHLSNTANLWTNGWKGILIEGDSQRFIQLQENVKNHDCVTINEYVGIESGKTLEHILSVNNLCTDIDILSIDVDGNDYHILSSIQNLKPRIIVCEYNPTIPYFLDVYPNYNNFFGSSIASLVRIAGKKGYRLISATTCNCFFVREDDFGRFKRYTTDMHLICPTSELCFLISGYGGEYMLTGKLAYGLGAPYAAHMNMSTERLRDLLITRRVTLKNFLKSLGSAILRRAGRLKQNIQGDIKDTE